VGMRIERSLHLPVIGGKVFAETKKVEQMSEINIFEPVMIAYTWGITFSIGGPTAHYVPAVVTLYEEEANKFRKDLLAIPDRIEEFRKYKEKEKEGVLGAFDPSFCELLSRVRLQNPLLEIKETAGKGLVVELNAWSPYWEFSREITLEATQIMADKLKNIKMQSQKMICALKLLEDTNEA